jgi:cell wall assembly regulator SMI1
MRNDMVVHCLFMARQPRNIAYRPKATFGTDSVETAWARIEVWLAQHLLQTYQALNPPASKRAITAFEKTIGQELPEPVRESYRRHNGHKRCSAGLLFGVPLHPLNTVLKLWETWKGYDRTKKTKYNFDDQATCFPHDAVQPVYFTRNWIPLSDDSGGNHIAIDLAPGDAGQRGQVIVCGRDDTFHPVLAWDWAQFLTDIADEMEYGNYRIDYHESEDDYEFNLGVPKTSHFHEVGANWSRCKLGMRKLSKEHEAIWKKRRRT